MYTGNEQQDLTLDQCLKAHLYNFRLLSRNKYEAQFWQMHQFLHIFLVA